MSTKQNRRATGGDRASGPAASSVKHRPGWIAFVVLGAIFCLAMGYWQLTRFQAASGTVQNLGYTFMWPFMAGFLIYAYVKYVRLEAEESDWLADQGRSAGQVRSTDQDRSAEHGVTAGSWEDDDDDTVSHCPTSGAHAPVASRARRRHGVITEIPADILPTRRPTADTEATDEGLAAYNTYLADLARRDAAGDRSQEKPAS
ncbi:hypothetical protein NCCP2495_05010 [Dietzia sp. NCCP-2495]|uniref:hypothetical protein n=1 Tax=Dietzia sp. NCCP-2495 TaxID=2934675 RepID=UPI00222FB451|nr:hypothetical protein [Dietzia sp. NCCP-2495]GLB62623.1 hypothetical protein NCCP2495_05010 [Dietzia sp. NCCP-2495]